MADRRFAPGVWVFVVAPRPLAAALAGLLLATGCRASEPADPTVCPAERVAEPGDALTAGLTEPIREQLAACELDRQPWFVEARVEDHVGLELAAEYRSLVQHGLVGPRRALVVRVLEADRARQVAERLDEAGVAVTRVDFGRRPTRAELDVLLDDFALIGEPGLAILALDGLAHAETGPCLRLADGCAPLTWLRDHVQELDDGLRMITLGGQSSIAAMRVLADAKTVAVVTSEDGLERFWMHREPGAAAIEAFAERAQRVADSGASIHLHEPIAGLALGRVERSLPARGHVTVAHARHDLELTRAMLVAGEPAYFALIPEDCGGCQLFRESYRVLASVDDDRRFWRIASREAFALLDADLRGLEYRQRNPGFAFRDEPEQDIAFEPRIAIVSVEGRVLPVDELGLPQASLWRMYGTLGVDAELDHLRAALQSSDDAIELVPMLAALARHPNARSALAGIAGLFAHPDGRVRLRALDAYVAIAGFDASSRCGLLAAFADPDRRVRLWAREWIEDPRLEPQLLTAAIALQLERSATLEVPGGVEARQRDLVAVLGQLARVDREATEMLVALLELPGFAMLHGEASRAIASVGPRAVHATASLVALVEAAPDPNLNVLRALAAMGDDAACAAPRLREIAADPSRPPEARERIRETLEAIVSAAP
jgi:hypothetical protein